MVGAFMQDRKAQNMSPGTLYFYRMKLKLFTDYCEAQVVTLITEITPIIIRQYLLYLEEQGHNAGGIHACYRTVKTFLLWWENEIEPDDWKNPIRKVKAPKVGIEPLEPVSLDDISTMVDTCQKSTYLGERDKAILFCLLDTGARAQEFLDVNLEDINLVTGSMLIRQGKGRKPRTVFLGAKSRKAVRTYLKQRSDSNNALWVTESGERLTYSGLRGIVRRRAETAGLKEPSLHSFRRAFAINMLRAGVDIYSLQELMGHADLQVLRRYLKQTNEDIAQAHRVGSPVDNNRL
jgi:integrase/recombinase XerD